MAPLFFDNGSSVIQLLSSYLSYSLLFLTGPIGSLLFGKICDKIQRSKVIVFSVVLNSLFVLLTGLIPTYQTIGIYAYILLMFVRIIRGVISGIEYAGALIYNYENCSQTAKSSAWVISSGCIGGSFAAVLCFLSCKFSIYDFSWRIPYIIGGIICVFIIPYCWKIQDQPKYTLQESNTFFFKEILTSYKTETIVGIAICALYTSVSYSSMIFGANLVKELGFHISNGILFSSINLMFTSISIYLFGKLSDVIGTLQQIRLSIILISILIYPLCWIISEKSNIISVVLYMFFTTLLSSLIGSCSGIFIIQLFPRKFRYSSFILIDSIGTAIGSLTPFMMLLLSNHYGKLIGYSSWIVIMVLSAAISLLLLLKKTNNK